MSCCAGASEPFKEVKDGETTLYYPLDYEITAVLNNDNTVTMKDCGCTKIFNNTAQSVSEFEPVLCWKNKKTGSIYQPEQFENALKPHGLISLDIELQEYNDSEEHEQHALDEEVFAEPETENDTEKDLWED